MKIFDLRGTDFLLVPTRVNNFLLRNEPPLKIITSDSDTVRAVVSRILSDFELYSRLEFYTNHSVFIVHNKII